MKQLLISLVFVCSLAFPALSVPLCTAEDPDFLAYFYIEHIARCKRNVSEETKKEIAVKYGIPVEEYKHYQYDHVISLCAGGSNAPENLQPRLPAKKLRKDKVEWAICRAMTRGEMSQRSAIEILRNLAVENANE